MRRLNRIMIVSIVLGVMATVAHGEVLRVASNSSGVRDFYIDDTAVIRHVPGTYATIQSAIDDAESGDTVLLADGTYTGEGNKDIRYRGKAITVMSENGSDECIIDCEGTGRAFQFCGGEKTDAVLKGVTIQNGNVTYPEFGGGIRFHNSSATISDCIIQNCHASSGGGGLGGIGTSPVVVNCVFKANSAYQYGGGLYLRVASNVVINNCIITDHTLTELGGGMSFNACQGAITNCLIANNRGHRGGGVYLNSSAIVIANCTITGNTAESEGGGLSCYESFPIIKNSILWDNQSPSGPEMAIGSEYDLDTVGHILYSDVKGGMASVMVGQSASLFWGDGMIDADPLFVSGPSGSFYLSLIDAGQSANSPCRNAGGDPSRLICFPGATGDVCMNQLTTRTDERTDINVVDMGYHYNSQTLLPPESPGGITPN